MAFHLALHCDIAGPRCRSRSHAPLGLMAGSTKTDVAKAMPLLTDSAKREGWVRSGGQGRCPACNQEIIDGPE